MPLVPASPDRPLTPGEALAKLFMDNADRGANTANDELIEELQRRIRALADPPPAGMIPPLPETIAQ
ncbi:MAG TPA: hypothetical protein VHY21_17660 [Pseudonocardiaceae bacterium]|jgi:hypothetical protein|nr:hypothetical protein [Pseudonocardiaceae bacterium]